MVVMFYRAMLSGEGRKMMCTIKGVVRRREQGGILDKWGKAGRKTKESLHPSVV